MSDYNQSASDLLSLVLNLRPTMQPKETETPIWWARAAHALLLRIIRQYDLKLAEALHEDNEVRPFTVSNLMGSRPGVSLNPEVTYPLRLTSFSPTLTPILHQALKDGPLQPSSQVELEYQPFVVESICADETENPWAGFSSYAMITAELMISNTNPAKQIVLQFASPTAFQSNGNTQPLPLASLVFGSLLNRWNAYAPINFPAELQRYVQECMVVSRFEVKSRSVPMKKGGIRIGAVGWVSYTTTNPDRYWLSLVHVLARFARFSGVGAGVANGLGQCRQLASMPTKREGL